MPKRTKTRRKERYTVSAPKGLKLWTRNGASGLKEVVLPPSEYTMEGGMSPNGSAQWLIYHHKGRLCGGMPIFVMGQPGVRVKGPH